jgi:hypothetical protein
LLMAFRAVVTVEIPRAEPVNKQVEQADSEK